MTIDELHKLVDIYGDNAYLMCEHSLINDKQQHWYDIFPSENMTLFTNLFEPQTFLVRIKQSAALPFDLVAANAGDVVEIRSHIGTWHICRGTKYEKKKHPIIMINDKSGFSIFNLRMKHPRRIGVNYD